MKKYVFSTLFLILAIFAILKFYKPFSNSKKPLFVGSWQLSQENEFYKYNIDLRFKKIPDKLCIANDPKTLCYEGTFTLTSDQNLHANDDYDDHNSDEFDQNFNVSIPKKTAHSYHVWVKGQTCEIFVKHLSDNEIQLKASTECILWFDMNQDSEEIKISGIYKRLKTH